LAGHIGVARAPAAVAPAGRAPAAVAPALAAAAADLKTAASTVVSTGAVPAVSAGMVSFIKSWKHSQENKNFQQIQKKLLGERARSDF